MTAGVPLRIVAPIVSSFVFFLAIAGASLRRRPTRGPRAPVVTGGGPFLRRLGATALGGYAVFLAIVLVFHVLIAGQRGAMRNAIAGGALLAFGVAVPVFALLSMLESALHRRGSSPR
jgi:Family of unknown function (DUF6256)